MAKPCLGVVLAGGRSRRMGCDKSLLLWGGRSLLVHALARFAEAGIENTVISGAYAGNAEYAEIPDLHPGAGPLAGIFAVANAHPGYRLIVVPVDMPKLPARWLQTLIAAKPNAPALHFESAPLPLRIDATAPLCTLLASWLADPCAPRALRHLLREISAHSIAAPDQFDDAFENANTPADWQRISK